MVQVHHDEGIANRIDPESCADAREGIGEALTGERIGQPLSRESTLILGADVVPVTEGNTDGRDNASAQTARRAHMPVSKTTPGRLGARVIAPIRVAFRHRNDVGTQDEGTFAAQWLAYALPCQRFANTLAGICEIGR